MAEQTEVLAELQELVRAMPELPLAETTNELAALVKKVGLPDPASKQ